MGPGLPALQKTQGTTMEAKMVAQGQAHENRYWVEVPFPSWRLAPQPPLHRQAQATYRVLLLSFRSLDLEHSTPLPTHRAHPLSWLNLFTPRISS